MNFTAKNQFFPIAYAVLLIFILWVAESLLKPILFALLIALVLFPLVKWFSRKGVAIVWSIIFSMLGVTLAVLGVLFFFSAQLFRIMDEYESFLEKMESLAQKVLSYVNSQIPFIPEIDYSDLGERLSEFLSESGLLIVSDTLNATGSFFSYLLLTIIYTFLILLYHKTLVRGATHFVKEEKREGFRSMLKDVQKVGQKYLTGMGILILILGSLNTIGLMIIGIDYAFFFGFFAAVLAIIPYLGTILGGLLPTLFALVTYDSYWYPVSVVLVFWFVQILEGNFLSPKIVGGNLNLNALAAVISLIAGGLLWGIAGMIIVLPLVAIFKVVCDNYEELQPVAMMIADVKDDDEGPGWLGKTFRKLKNKVT